MIIWLLGKGCKGKWKRLAQFNSVFYCKTAWIIQEQVWIVTAGAALPKPHGVSGISWTVTTKLCWADNAFISNKFITFIHFIFFLLSFDSNMNEFITLCSLMTKLLSDYTQLLSPHWNLSFTPDTGSWLPSHLCKTKENWVTFSNCLRKIRYPDDRNVLSTLPRCFFPVEIICFIELIQFLPST